MYASEVIEHVTDDVLFLSEIYRVLKRDGYFILSTPNGLLEPLMREYYDAGLVRHYSELELRHKLEKCGFSHIITYFKGHSLTSTFDKLVYGLGRRFIRSTPLTHGLTYWRSKTQPTLSRMVLTVYGFIINPMIYNLIKLEFEILKKNPGRTLILVAQK